MTREEVDRLEQSMLWLTDRLEQRMLWLTERIKAKDKIGWDTTYDKSERDALKSALHILRNIPVG